MDIISFGKAKKAQQKADDVQGQLDQVIRDGISPKDGSVTPEKTTFMDFSSNLFNKEKAIPGTNFDNSTGEPVESSSYSLGGFFKVKPNTDYSSINVPKIGFYKDNGDYISFIEHSQNQHQVWTTPDETAWISSAIFPARIDIAQINEGSELLAYEPYYVLLSDEIRIPEQSSELEQFLTTENEEWAVE